MTEPKDAVLTTKNQPLPKDTSKKSKRKEPNISSSIQTNPQVFQELWSFPKKKPKENPLEEEEVVIDMMFTLDL